MKLKGGQAVVRSLDDNEVKIVYGLPGSEILEIYNSLRETKQIKHVLAMHEVNAAYMADAHGRLTGDPGVCLMSAGPGATNAITGIAQAFTEASPVVQITGHPNYKIQPDHCVDDWDFLLKLYEPITKWSSRIESVCEIPSTLSKSFQLATSGRPGPVHTHIPQSILETASDIEVNTPSLDEIWEGSVDLSDSIELLKSASQPLIVVGKGVLREFCSDNVMRLAELLGAPILTLQNAVGSIPFDFRYYLGFDMAGSTIHPIIKPFVSQADVIITLGFDVGERLISFKTDNAVIIHVHIDDNISHIDKEIEKTKEIDLTISLNTFLSTLLDELVHNQRRYDDISKKINLAKKKIQDDIVGSIAWGKNPVHPGEIGCRLHRLLDDDAIVTLDEGSSANWMRWCYRPKTTNTILTPGRFHSMGFSLPAAIAAKINFPDRQVISVTGDGGFLMSYMDFPTLVKYQLDIVVVIETNHQYGMMWQIQRSKYRGKPYMTEIQVPDFSEYARSFGATGIKVTKSSDLKTSLEEALNCKGPVIIDIETDYKASYYTPNKLKRYMSSFKNLGIR